jgi:lysophospholipase L1-like esterase
MILAAAWVVVRPAVAHAESNGGVRIMPLGDSITDGNKVPGGYRINLWQSVGAGGYQVDFVGSRSNGPAGLGDHDHEGHPGWRIDQLDANIVSWLRATTPRTILLLIGTNDVDQNYDLANAPARLSTLIDHIAGVVPAVELFVATITPQSNATYESRARTYNAAIPGVVSRQAAAGRHVHLVDMHAALTTADLSDGTHPTRAGYDKMAAVWYNALRSVPGSLSGSNAGVPVRLGNVASGTCLDVNGASHTAGTATVLFPCGAGTNQQWTRTAADELRVYGDRCLDVSGRGTAAGTPVIIWTCTGAGNQQWTLNAGGTITSVSARRCLAPAGAAAGNGTAITIADCTGATSQQWTQQ